MTPAEYVKAAYAGGQLTDADIVRLVRYFQTGHAGLAVDGMPGPQTLQVLRPQPQPVTMSGPFKFLRNPLPLLAGAYGTRRAQITSSFRPADRPDHNGCDFFYRWQPGDKPDFIGDGGCAGGTPGAPKWVVPYGTDALAAEVGVIQLAGPSPTGYRVWVDHGNGWRTGYFHLEKLYVKSGDKVQALTALGLVGHNPIDNDGRHLHFEVSPVDKYDPRNPEGFLL